MTILCDACGKPADGLVTITFYPENGMMPHVCYGNLYACRACIIQPIWKPLIDSAVVKLSSSLGRVVWHGSQAAHEHAIKETKRRKLPLEWIVKIDLSLTPLDHPDALEVASQLVDERAAHVQGGGRIH